jgi:hypothetical protein
MWEFNWGVFWAVLAALAVRGLCIFLKTTFIERFLEK